MRLAELIDLESQLLRDEAALRAGEGKKLLDRDRAVGETLLKDLELDPEDARSRLDGDVDLRRRVALGWLAALGGKVPALPGARMERGYRFVGVVLGLVGVFLGVAAASAALAYDGSTPVNVFGFLSGLVLLQVVLLVGMILVMSVRGATGVGGVMGWAQALVIWMSRARWVDRMLRSLPEESTATVAAFGARRQLYGGAERWLLFTLTQRFGFLFNASALVTCLLLVTFTDLAFCWSTTLDLSAEDVRAWLRTIASPWSGFVEDAIPSAEVVRRSEWLRRDGGGFIAGATDADMKAWGSAWWRFLVAALCFWGLLPRLIAYLVGGYRSERALASASLDHGAFQRLYQRLLPVEAGWKGPSPNVVGDGVEGDPGSGDEGAVSTGVGSRRRSKPARARRQERKQRGPEASVGVGTCLVLWGHAFRARDAVEKLTAERFDGGVAAVARAGGADLALDRAAVTAVDESGAARVALVVEAGVQPTKEIFAFLREIRESVGARMQLIVALVQVDSDELRAPDTSERDAWAYRVEAEGDPYLRFEDMVEQS